MGFTVNREFPVTEATTIGQVLSITDPVGEWFPAFWVGKTHLSIERDRYGLPEASSFFSFRGRETNGRPSSYLALIGLVLDSKACGIADRRWFDIGGNSFRGDSLPPGYAIQWGLLDLTPHKRS